MLFSRIYEDNVAGKISNERFGRMSKKYEQEQGKLTKRIKLLWAELKKESGQLYTADAFLEIVRFYTGTNVLTQCMVSERIIQIDVYHAQQMYGKRTQKVKNHYNCIGAFEVPAPVYN